MVGNEDRRIPGIDKDEVVIRREFRLHSDDFYVEGKKTTKKDVEEYFDVAGLSGKNPYFIVQQGESRALSGKGIEGCAGTGKH